MNQKYEMCKCGHFGGNSDTKQQHEQRVQLGHGQCVACECNQFTWIGFCDKNGNISNEQ